jgi:tetratricopeptide (TPR) repeat protein
VGGCILRILATVVSLEAGVAQDYVAEGERALAQRQYARAQALFETALGAAPENPRALAGLGIALCRQAEYARGLELLLEARQRGFEEPPLLLETARAYYMLERPLDALEPLRRFVAAKPDDAEAQQLLGLCLEHVPDLEGAARAYERSLVLGAPAADLVLYHLGKVYRRLDREPPSEDVERRLIQEHPESPYARLKVQEQMPELDPWTRLRRERRQKPWYVAGTLQVQFDTNPLALGEDAVVPPNLADREVWNLLASLGGGDSFELSDSLRVGLDARYTGLYRDELAAFDLGVLNVGTWVEFDLAEAWETGLSLGWRRVWLDDRKVLEEGSVGTWIAWREAFWTRTRLDVGFANQEYFFESLARPLDPDQTVLQATITQEALVPQTRLGLALGYARAERNSDGTDFRSGADTVFLRASHPLVWDIRAIGGVYRTWARFAHGSAREPGSPRRRDDVLGFTLRLERPLSDELTAHLQFTLTDNESNLGTFDYDQNVWAAGIDFRF